MTIEDVKNEDESRVVKNATIEVVDDKEKAILCFGFDGKKIDANTNIFDIEMFVKASGSRK